MKKVLASFLLASLLGMPTFGAPALAQNADGTLGSANSLSSQQIDPQSRPGRPVA
jgi:hypothetical protein